MTGLVLHNPRCSTSRKALNLAAALFLVLSFAAFAKDDPKVHEMPGAGITLTKPAGWKFEMKMSNVAVVEDPAKDGPVFVIASHAMPTPPPDSAPDLLNYTVKSLIQQYPDFKIEKPVRATTVIGRHAAELTATYSATIGKQTIHLRSRIVLIPREGGIVVVNMTTPPDKFETAHVKLASILDSLTIGK